VRRNPMLLRLGLWHRAGTRMVLPTQWSRPRLRLGGRSSVIIVSVLFAMGLPLVLL
jgi:hypothetical protein